MLSEQREAEKVAPTGHLPEERWVGREGREEKQLKRWTLYLKSNMTGGRSQQRQLIFTQDGQVGRLAL